MFGIRLLSGLAIATAIVLIVIGATIKPDNVTLFSGLSILFSYVGVIGMLAAKELGRIHKRIDDAACRKSDGRRG